MYTYIFIIVTGIICFLIGVLSVNRKTETHGTIILNKNTPGKPPIELHIEKDPDEVKDGEIMSFKLEVH